MNPDNKCVRGLGERLKTQSVSAHWLATDEKVTDAAARAFNRGRSMAFKSVSEDCKAYVERRAKEGGQ